MHTIDASRDRSCVCGARILELNWIGSILARIMNVGRQEARQEASFVAVVSDQMRLLNAIYARGKVIRILLEYSRGKAR